jgi:hypothetical protein
LEVTSIKVFDEQKFIIIGAKDGKIKIYKFNNLINTDELLNS